MFLLLVAVVVAGLVLWLAAQWNKVRRYWKARGVPHYPPHPVLGSLTFLQRENPALWFRRAYETFGEPYMGMWLFWRPALVVNCPQLARRILVKDADNFRNHYLSSGKYDPLGSLNLLACNDPLWSSLRKHLSPVFTSAKLRSFQGMMRSKAKDLVGRVAAESEGQELFNLRDIVTLYTTDVIGESAFGLKCESTRTGDSIIKQVTREFMEFSLIRGLSWSSIFFLPELIDLSRGFLSMFPKGTIRRLRVLFRGMLQQRGEVSAIRDLLDALINMKQLAAKEGQEMTEDILLAQATVFLIGGFDTSGSAMTMALYELGHNLEAQDKLYNELKATKERLGTDIDAQTLSELPYLNAVIKETLRKYPPLGWLDRVSEQEYKIDETLTLPAGSVVYVNAIGMHHDPRFFARPDQFEPERFLPQNEREIRPYTYMPFGEGPRACIGRRFGQQVLQVGLSSLALQFRLRAPPRAPPPTQVRFETRGVFYMPIDKLELVFTPRETTDT